MNCCSGIRLGTIIATQGTWVRVLWHSEKVPLDAHIGGNRYLHAPRKPRRTWVRRNTVRII